MATSNQQQFEEKKQQAVNFMHNSVLAVDEKDERVWALITDVPRVGNPMHIILFALNCVLPGTGTMILSCYGDKWSKTQFALGVFQLFLTYILIGWIFSIYWGYLIYQKSTTDPIEVNQFLNNRALRSD